MLQFTEYIVEHSGDIYQIDSAISLDWYPPSD